MTDTTLANRPAQRMFSPAALIGAAVLVASLGAAAGWMMHASHPATDADASRLALAPNETVVPAQPSAPQAPTAQPSALPPPVQSAAPQQQPVHHHAPVHSAAPNHPAATNGQGANSGTTVASNGSTPIETQRAAVCDNCGVIEGVRAYQQKGEGSGMGAVAGGVLGGLLGHQVGKGNGRAAMTVLGAVGGGIAGNEVEKRVKAETLYEVRVRMDDGTVRTFTEKTAPTPGAHVVVEGNHYRVSSQGGTGSGTNMVRTSGQGA
jgi:outer membrane lipoprotein SlyB